MVLQYVPEITGCKKSDAVTAAALLGEDMLLPSFT